MLDAGGGGGYAGTDWQSQDVRQMWSAVEDQQTDPHWKVVSGWQRTYELTFRHLTRLTEYRDRLAEAWPPERSAASAAYIAHLDYLMNHVQATFDVAVVNSGAFAGAASALTTTRSQLQKIRDEYEANESKLAGWDRQMEDWRKTPIAPKAGKPPAPRSPVPSGRQEELNNQARGLMYRLSSELILARAAIRQPPPYQPPQPGRAGGDSDAFGGGGGGSIAPPPPVIPPVVALPNQPPTTGAGAVPAPGVVGPATGSGAGPTLGGTGTLPAPGTVNPTLPPQATTLPAPPAGGGVIGPPVAPIVPPAVRPPAGGVIGGPGAVPQPGAGAAAAPPKPMPVGGVIGPIGQPVAGQPAGGRPTPQRVNPVGGVIGQRPGGGPVAGPAGARPGGPAVPAMTGAAATGGRAGGRRAGDEPGGRSWDPDNPWATETGVDPVVLPPPPAGRFDPGPAIGFDR
jgi:hypothetical protein